MVPYYFTFTTFTKGRWVGETILTVFSREFRAQPRQLQQGEEYEAGGPEEGERSAEGLSCEESQCGENIRL